MINRMNWRIGRLLAACCITLALASVALAQNSTLRGIVQDERGDAIPNADVTLKGKDGKERTAKSGVTGEFTIPNVPAGVYSMTSAYQGFQPFLLNELKVPYTGVVAVKMAIAAVEVVTDVSANSSTVSTDPDQNMNAIALNEKEIENLPDNEDDLRDFLNAMAGGGVNGQGANILVDGFTGGRLPPKEAIARIVFNQNPFSAEYSNPGFGRVEIITKPGYGEWRGSGSVGYRNSSLDARNAFAIVKPPLEQQRYDFFIGGPLMKKKLSTSFFFNRQDTDGSTPTLVKTLDGNLAEVTLAPNVNSTTVNTYAGARTDYLINKNNTINVNYNYRTSETVNAEFANRFGGGFGFGFGGGGGAGGGGGGGGASSGNNLLAERGSNRENSNHTLRVTETWIINTKMIHEARLQYQHEHTDQTPNTQALAINVLDSVSLGGNPNYPTASDNSSAEYQDYLTVTLKKHTIKGGVQFDYERVHDLSSANFFGTYTFSSLDQYRAALLALSDPTAPKCNPNVPIDPQSSVVSPCATQFTINRGQSELEYDMFRGSWFVMDDFRIKPSLTLSYGLRHEFQSHLVDKLNLAPRFGLAWSPFKNRKTTIRAGLGVFYDRLTDGNYENTIRFNGVTQESFTIRNAVFNPNNLPTSGGQDTTRGQTIRILDPNLRAPYSINGSISVEQQLPKGLVGTFTYFQDRGIHQFRTRNINAPYPDPNNPAVLITPNPAEGFVYQLESSARSVTNRMDFGMQRRLGKFTAFGRYSLGWMNTDAGGVPADNYNLRLEWGRASSDRRHNAFIGSFINLPKGFRLNSSINISSGAPFNITTGFDENRDGSVNDRPAGLRRDADLTPDFYSQPLFDRLICIPGNSTKFTGSGVVCVNSAGAISNQISLRAFLQKYYPNGVSAEGPGNFGFNSSLSKTFSFGHRNNGGQNGQNGNGDDGQQGGRGGRGGGRGGGGGGGGRGGGGGGGGFGGRGGGGGFGGPGGFGGNETGRFNLTVTFNVTNVFNHVNYGQYSGTLGSSFFGLPSSAAAARQMDFNVRFNF